MKLKSSIKIGLIILLYTTSFYVSGQDITNISSKFCNDGILTDNLNFSTDSAKTNEICTQFSNSSDKDISIMIGFPDGTVTNDNFKNKACKTEGNIENFGKYVIQKNKSLIIPAGKTITEKNYIKFPAGYDGIVHGCMTYFLNPKYNQSNNGVNIVVRQTNYIDILVGSNFKRDISLKNFYKINNLGSNKRINTDLNLDSTLFIKLLFENKGDIDEIFIGKGTISGLFGFSKDFDIIAEKIQSNNTKEVEINIGSIPFYAGLFKIQIDGNVHPEISFNKDSLSEELKREIEIKEKTTIVIIPRNIIIGIIIFFIVFFSVRYIKKRRLTISPQNNTNIS